MGEISFHFKKHLPRRTIYKKKKKKKDGKDSEDGGEVFSKVVTEKISHHSQQFLPPFLASISLYTQYI